jgi:O-antigen ligase
MIRSVRTILTIDTFRIWDYPLFAIFFGYIWLELANSTLASSLQIIPMIPNSAIALGFSYLTQPDYLKQIRVPFKPVSWLLPFLIMATINLPFIQYEQFRSFVELISTWFWALFLLPLMIRVLATPSGRWHYVLFSAFGLIILSAQYYSGLSSGQFDWGGGTMSYHHLSASVIPLFPILVAYFFIKKGFSKLFLMICLTVVALASVPAGARSMWLILPIQFLFLVLFILPKGRLLISSIVIMAVFSFFMSFSSVGNLYSNSTLQNLDIRLRKTREWQEDTTIWKRLGMVIKTRMILEEYPLLGIGYSNRSFASYDGGVVEIMGHLARVRKYDAHNTYLNILAGTGTLGFLAFLFFMRKIWIVFRKIPPTSWRRLDFGPFILSVVGVLINNLVMTVPFTEIIFISALILALYIYQYNLQIANTMSPERKNNELRR